MPYGNFYYGKGGFQFKKMTGGGVRRNFAIGAICNQPQDIYNVYVPGAGVGGTSIATRRAKLIRATKCYGGHKCGRFFTYLGIKPQQKITSLDIISEIEEVKPKPPLYIPVNPAVPRLLDYNPVINSLQQFTIVTGTQNLDGEYITESSSQYDIGVIYFIAAAAFGEPPTNYNNYWHGAAPRYNGGTGNDGLYIQSYGSTTNINGVQQYGDWLQITLPYSLQLTSYAIGYRIGYSGRVPYTWYIVGRNLDTEPWTKLDYIQSANIDMINYDLSKNTKIFNTYRIVVIGINPNGSQPDCVNMVMQLYGNKIVYV